MKNFTNILKILFIALMLISFDALLIEPNVFLSNTRQLDIPNWNKDLNGFKVALISDVHLGTRFVDMKKLNEIVNVTNKNNPDLVVICGDLDAKAIAKKNYSTTEVANSLKNLKAKYGVVAIMGNHDYEMANIIYEIYQKAGIKLLKNQDYFINVNNEKIRIVGLEDLWFRNVNPIEVIGEENKNVPTIVLAHNPDYFPQIPKSTSITLSGHTHGGEIVFPFVGSFIVPSKYGNRYRNGHIIEDNKHLFVSRGVATLGYGRFIAPAEINFLELYSQTKIPKDSRDISGSNKPFSPKLVNKFRSFYKSKFFYSK